MKPKAKTYFYLNNPLNEKGIALISVMIIGVCLCLVGSAYMSGVTKEASGANDQILRTQSLFSAESGVEYAKRQLIAADWNATTGWSNVADGAGGTNNITFTYDAGANLGTITSTSNYQGRQKTLIVQVSRITSGGTTASPFDKAACSCNNLSLTGNGNVDSYDSSIGAYSAGSAGSNGHLGSNGALTLTGNGTTKGNVSVTGNVTHGGNGNINGNLKTAASHTMSGNAHVHGNVETGGNLSGSNNNYIYGTAMVGGTESFRDSNATGGLTLADPPALPTPCDCSSIDLATLIPAAATSNSNSAIPGAYLSGSNFSIAGNNILTLNAGTYYFTGFSVAGNAQININGQVIIYMAGNGAFNIAGNGIYNTTTPHNVKIYSNSTGNIDLAGNGSLMGTVYAPTGTFRLTGNNNIYGATVANNVNITGNGNLHYDTSLADATEPVGGGGGTVTVQVVSWSQYN